MELVRRVNNYRRVHGMRALLKRLTSELFSKFTSGLSKISNDPNSDQPSARENGVVSALMPLNAYLLPNTAHKTIFVVTDSIGSSSLFGGVGTAIILGVLAANRLCASLKIITRTEPSNPDDLEKFLGLLSLKLRNEVAFIFAPPVNNLIEIGYSTGDLFITTSWWTTLSTFKSVPSNQIRYLLQEDERMFYAFGDERLQCDAVLRNPDVSVIVNTKLLFDHLSADGTINFDRSAIWFEPSFPSSIYSSISSGERHANKRRFFFYARPNNPRNLYEFGINLIKQAIDTGIISLDEWDIYFVGKNIPPNPLGNRGVPIICEGLDWRDYSALIQTMDLGLCLMYTPHPSYPPLDLVASGAVVVTNRFGNKVNLENYSKNIITEELNYQRLLFGLSMGVDLSKNNLSREANYKTQCISRNWEQSFAKTLASLTAPQ